MSNVPKFIHSGRIPAEFSDLVEDDPAVLEHPERRESERLLERYRVPKEAETPWTVNAPQKPYHGVEKLCEGMVMIETDRFYFVDMNPSLKCPPWGEPAFAAALESEKPTVLFWEGKHISLEAFTDMWPEKVDLLAIDGVIPGDPMKVEHNGRTRQVMDHHGRDRMRYRSTCWQMLDAVIENKPLPKNVLVEGIDQDSLLALFLRVYAPEIRSGMARNTLVSLVCQEDLVDRHAAATNSVSFKELAQLRGILPEAANGHPEELLRAHAHALYLMEGFWRIAEVLKGNPRYASLACEYGEHRRHGNAWSDVYETSPVARRFFVEEGYPGMLFIEKKNGNTGTNPKEHAYSLHKTDVRHPLHITPELYGCLNWVHAYGKNTELTPDSVLAMLRELGPSAIADLHKVPGPFGGTDRIGGGRTELSWQCIDAALEWYWTESAAQFVAYTRNQTQDKIGEVLPKL